MLGCWLQQGMMLLQLDIHVLCCFCPCVPVRATWKANLHCFVMDNKVFLILIQCSTEHIPTVTTADTATLHPNPHMVSNIMSWIKRFGKHSKNYGHVEEKHIYSMSTGERKEIYVMVFWETARNRELCRLGLTLLEEKLMSASFLGCRQVNHLQSVEVTPLPVDPVGPYIGRSMTGCQWKDTN